MFWHPSSEIFCHLSAENNRRNLCVWHQAYGDRSVINAFSSVVIVKVLLVIKLTIQKHYVIILNNHTRRHLSTIF